MKYSTGFIVTLNVDEKFVDGEIALPYVSYSWQKGISPSNFLRVISTTG